MQSGQEGQEVMELASRLNTNLTKLKDIEKVDLPAQVVPHTAGLEEAIDIFDRINSQGIKLTDADSRSRMSQQNGRWRDV
jgi:hypothetical protein